MHLFYDLFMVESPSIKLKTEGIFNVYPALHQKIASFLLNVYPHPILK